MITINRIKSFVPGVVNVFALPMYNVESIVNDLISIKDVNAYYRIEFSNQNLEASYQPVKSERGEYYDVKISGFIPGESVINTKILNIIRKYRFIVIYQESDGTYRWAGSQSAGLLLSLAYNSGSDANPQKGYNLSFEGQLLNHPKPSKPYISHLGEIISLKPSDQSSSTE